MRPASLTIDLNHLVENYHLLQQQAGKAAIMAVVKANAYGHGLLPIAQALYQCGCRSFAVTDATEGIQLRQTTALDASIILFSGIDNIDDAKVCVQHQLSPVCVHSTQLAMLQKADFKGSVWLKVDTGMNRLGAEGLALLISEVEQAKFQLAGIMSHLACADTPEHPLNLQQIKRFKQIQQDTLAPAYSLLNSAGLIAFPSNIPTDIVRPGLALYGIEPITDQPLGLKPIAELGSQIIQIRNIKQGESVSYNGTWVAPYDMRIAIVAMGYADGLPRLLSNQGHAWHPLGALPIVGRVCMDYCMLAVEDANIKQGDKVVFFGSQDNQPRANQVAAQCQTIAYELFTHLSERLHRTYIGEA
ncbi:MAG TPA: alanine racemase [Mariprofundaceae bacterium]|nr:alanine racemase [Mariprofundaceae bacterium]